MAAPDCNTACNVDAISSILANNATIRSASPRTMVDGRHRGHSQPLR
jgi:hypothetical protein